MLGSENWPDALHLGSSGNRSKNLSSWNLNEFTDLPLIRDIAGGRQFQRLEAVRAKEELRGITAGL